jgi:arsenate reductase (thioredoxin)
MKKVLFVCVHNAGRSQMAEAFFNKLAAERGLEARAESAGTKGAGSLNSVVVHAMEEAGVSMEGHKPKQLTQEMADAATNIVSMGCGVDAAACPAKFLVTEDWGLEDPAGQPMGKVRQIRDQIKARVEQLLSE